MTIGEMRRGLEAGEFSEAELLAAHQEQVARWNPRLNAIVAPCEPVRTGDGPLKGIPLTIKDSLDIAGMPTVCGIPERLTRVPGRDALCVRRLRAAGAVILGKTNTPEWLMNWDTANEVYGVTRNPWGLEYSPGGSSGGESAAIAARMSAGGMGSDGGGSIRVPAALTGICGLKPTPGRVPATGHFPAIAHPGGLLGVIGPMARTVSDVRLLYEVVAGHDDSDPFSAPVGELPLPKEIRIGLAGGAKIPDAGFATGEFASKAWDRIYEVWEFFFLRLNAHPIGKPTIHTARWLEEPAPTAAEVLSMLVVRDALRARFLAAMDEYPVLALPNPGCAPWRSGEFPGPAQVMWLAVANLLGLPALALPTGIGEAGLPESVQLVAKPWQEGLLLAVGEKLEEARGVFPAPPLVDKEWA